MTGDREKCIAAGCSDHLSKPVERIPFIAKARAYLHPVCKPADNPDGPIKSTATDPTILRFAPMFVDGLPALIDQLNAAVRVNDVATLHCLLHELKGTGAMYGFAAITSRATSADELLGAHNSIDAVRGDIASLIQFIGRIDGFDRHKLAISDQDKESRCH
jgi:HPt (histidine-containing phosphotransfer) domain-containing protein